MPNPLIVTLLAFAFIAPMLASLALAHLFTDVSKLDRIRTHEAVYAAPLVLTALIGFRADNLFQTLGQMALIGLVGLGVTELLWYVVTKPKLEQLFVEADPTRGTHTVGNPVHRLHRELEDTFYDSNGLAFTRPPARPALIDEDAPKLKLRQQGGAS